MNKQFKMLDSVSEETSRLLFRQSGETVSILAPNLSFSAIDSDNGYVRVHLPIKLDKEILSRLNLDMPITFNLEHTNDPTNNIAAGVVSLGYYLLRLTVYSAKVELGKKDGIYFTAKKDNVVVLVHRPQRDVYQEQLKGINLVDRNYQLDPLHIKRRRYYILPKNLWNDMYSTLSVISDESNKTHLVITEKTDMRSYFTNQVITECKKFKTYIAAKKYLEELLRKTRKEEN